VEVQVVAIPVRGEQLGRAARRLGADRHHEQTEESSPSPARRKKSAMQW